MFDPNSPSIMYYGGNILNRTANVKPSTGAPVRSAISPSLSNPESGTDPAYPFGTITTVAVAKTDPNVLYAGTDDGLLWGSTDGGANWTRFIDPALPNRWVARVAVDPTNAKVVYVTYSGYRNADNSAHILRSADGGAHWVDISGNLPAAPTQDVIVDPTNRNRVFVASDLGVFIANVAKSGSKAQGSSIRWRQLGSGLPAAPVNDLRYHQPTNTLYAATYRRSIWKLQLDRDDVDVLGDPRGGTLRGSGSWRRLPQPRRRLRSSSRSLRSPSSHGTRGRFRPRIGLVQDAGTVRVTRAGGSLSCDSGCQMVALRAMVPRRGAPYAEPKAIDDNEASDDRADDSRAATSE